MARDVISWDRGKSVGRAKSRAGSLLEVYCDGAIVREASLPMRMQPDEMGNEIVS